MSRKRSYQSPLRDEHAIETRARIRRAAYLLFEQQGFGTTTIAQIAREAKVSVPTVYAVFGSKAGIVHELMDELEQLASADTDGAEILDETDPGRQLALFAKWIRMLFERGEPILRAVRAAGANPDTAAMVAVGNTRRREGTSLLTEGWASRGRLASGVDAASAADTLWLLTSAELYFLAVDTLRWSPDQYERWLVQTATTQLIQGSSKRRPSTG
jgi:TetR/AcrR family transcriptional regulator, regulator of cefoperazone and chloramphenicol sensitivity